MTFKKTEPPILGRHHLRIIKAISRELMLEEPLAYPAFDRLTHSDTRQTINKIFQEPEFLDSILVLVKYNHPKVKKFTNRVIKDLVVALCEILSYREYTTLHTRLAYETLKKLEQNGVDVFSILSEKGITELIIFMKTSLNPQEFASELIVAYYLHNGDLKGLLSFAGQVSEPSGQCLLNRLLPCLRANPTFISHDFLIDLANRVVSSPDFKDFYLCILDFILKDQQNYADLKDILYERITGKNNADWLRALHTLDHFANNISRNNLLLNLTVEIVILVFNSKWFEIESNLNSIVYTRTLDSFADVMETIRNAENNELAA
ncbi:MAG: hypothetical protein Q7S22_00380 [Candidatus Micrarchaeota archaeon]|nr:hypothetical protein [Candidatus Micrarchaeota archaeon]